eukprot:8186851-Karenia_brevis.AAC.1
MGNVSSFADSLYLGWPCFSDNNQYAGPLPSFCGHERHQPLIGQDGTGKFHTSKAAAYPAQLCEIMATSLISSLLTLKSFGKEDTEAHQSLAWDPGGPHPSLMKGMATKATWDPGGPHPSLMK